MTYTTRRALIAAAAPGLATQWNATPAAAHLGPVGEDTLGPVREPPRRVPAPAAPGGGWDGTAQVIAQVLRETGTVQAVQFEYRPGAGGALALPRLVVGLRGERNVLMVGGLTQLSSAIVNQSALTLFDTAPIARLEGEPLVLAVRADSSIGTVTDFARLLRADPLGLRVAGGSEGGADNILLAMIGRTLGIDPFALSYIAFSGGGPAAAAVLANRAQAGISNWSEFAPHIEAGRMRALASSSEARDVGVDVPTLRERGIDAVIYNWNAVFAP